MMKVILTFESINFHVNKRGSTVALVENECVQIFNRSSDGLNVNLMLLTTIHILRVPICHGYSYTESSYFRLKIPTVVSGCGQKSVR